MQLVNNIHFTEAIINNYLEKFNSSQIADFEDEIPNTYPIPEAYNWNKISAHGDFSRILLNKKVKSLYINIPFCNYRCDFCVYDTRSKYDSDVLSNYTKLVMQELTILKKLGNDFSNLSRIYIGGGTPSILHESHLQEFFNCLDFLQINIKDAKSFTFELSPESISTSKIQLLKEFVNRFSIGVQDINPSVLSNINRRTNSAIINKALELLSMNVEYFNVDLIYGLPGQTEQNWIESIKHIISFKTPEVTLYNARVGHNTILTARSINNVTEKMLFILAKRLMEENHYIQVRPFHWVRDSRIKELWKEYKFAPFSDQHANGGGHEIGVGTSAVSHIGKYLFRNFSILDFTKYSELVSKGILPWEKVHILTRKDQMIRNLLRGIEEGKFKLDQVDTEFIDTITPFYETLKELAFVIEKGRSNDLSSIGKVFYNNIEKELIWLLNKPKT